MDNKNIGRIDISQLINVKLHDYKFNFGCLEYVYKIADLPKKMQDQMLKNFHQIEHLMCDSFVVLFIHDYYYQEHKIAEFNPFILVDGNRQYLSGFDVYYGRKKATSYDNRCLLKQFYFDVKTNDLIRKDIDKYTKLLSDKLLRRYLAENGCSFAEIKESKYSFLLNTLRHNNYYCGTGFYRIIKDKFYEIHGDYLQELLLSFDTLFNAVHDNNYMNKFRVYSLSFEDRSSIKTYKLEPLIQTIKDLCFEELKQIKSILKVA
jgi:hypothetical protein